MPIYSVKGPDGRIYDVEGPAGASDEQVIAFLQQHLAASPEQKPKEGLIAGLQKGAESTFSQLRSGIGSLIGSPEEAARAGLERGEDINKRYAQQVSLDKVKQAYADKGLMSAAGEALGQIPYALAEQIPNLVTNIGGARLGALAGAPFGPVGSIIGGGAGLIAPSVLQQLGGNVERQAAEGQPVSVGQALPTAVLQGGLDVAGSFIPLGGRLVSKLTGLPVEALLGRTSAQAAKLAEERLLATLAKGTATGAFVEIPTEVTQQMLQRAQAGLPLTSPDALKEYGETAYQAGLLGPLGAVGRMSEVGGARQQVEQEQMLDMRQKRIAGLEQEEKDRAAQEAEKAQAEQARQEQLKDPEFAMQAEARYNDLQQQFASLREQANSKVDPTDLAGIEARNAARQQLKAFKKTDEYKSVMDDYQQTASIRDNLKKQREEQTRIQTEAARQKEIQDQLAVMGQAPGVQQQIPGLEPMETENVPPPPQEDLTARRSEFMQKQQELAQLMESHQRKEADAAAKGDIDALDKLRPQRQMLLNEQEYLNKQLGEMGAEPADDSLDAIRAKIEKQKAQLQSLGGEGYDPVKADKIIKTIRALEEKAKTAKPGQMGLDFGKATKEQVSETQQEFTQRLTEAQAARRKALEEEYQQKIRPEIQGIQRIAGRKDEGPEMGIEIPTRGGEPTLEGSAAMGQMQQALRGATPGEQGEFIYTAPEVVTTPPKVQKAPSEGFQLFARQGEPTRANTSEEIEQRIASALAQPGLTDETYAFLRRAENILPKTDNQGVLSLLDKQLRKIESGAEGRAKAGAPKPTTLQAFPIGETAVSKRVSDVTRDTLRGPSAKAQPLSLQEEIEPLLTARERALSEDQADQMGLFPDEEKKLGYIKPDRAAFERFMRSPFVNKLRKALRTDQKAIERAKLDDLKVKIKELQAKADEMEKIRLDYSDAARTIQLNRDLGKQRQDINKIRAVMTDRVIDRMELQGRIEGMQQLRRMLIDEARDLGETVEPLFLELNDVENQLHELNVDSSELTGVLKTLEAQMKVEAAKITLAKLNPQRVSKDALATAKQNLLDAQRAKGVIESETNKNNAKQIEEAARAKRTADAVAAAKSVKERIDLSKAKQERLEAMYGESVRGIEIPAISEAQRASREMGEPVLSEEEQFDVTKNPLKVLGGYRSSITAIEKRLQQAQATSNEARLQDLKDLLETRDKLDKQYKAAQFADQRSEILPKLEAAENAYDDAATKLASEPLTWKGMAKDIQELSEFYNKADSLEDKINSGKIRLPEEKPPKVVVKPSQEQKKAVAEKIASEQGVEAGKRANAPTTSGEKLTRSEVQKRIKPEKTTYSSKGIGPAGLSKQDQDKLEMLREKKKAGKTLNVFEQSFLDQKEKYYPSGINFSKGVVKEGLTAETLQKELDKAVGGKGVTQSRVQVFDSVEDFYVKDRNAQYDYPNLPTDAKAFVDPKTGQAFMFANNIGKGDGLGVFLHEVGAHLGFRNLFNQTQYNALVKAVKNWSVKNDGSLESRVAKAAIERIKAAKTSAEQYDDELLAYAIEEAVKAGVTPSALRNGSLVRNWLTTVLNLLKKALAKFGINPDKMVAGDLVNLAYGAAQLEVRGTWHGSDATFKAFDTAYATTGEGAFDRRFDGDNSLGVGPYVTPDKEYGEYYQQAVPFGKAANKSGYGRYSYQDYAEALANETYKADTDRSVAEIQRVFESNLLHRYLNSLLNGGNLDPTKNIAAVSYIPELKTNAAALKTDAETQLASRQKRKVNADRIEEAEKYLAYALRFDKAVDTLDVSKIKGLTARPTKGNLYRTLDDIPREKVFSVNSSATVGERPKIDALLKKYGPSYEVRNFEQDGKYNMNSLYYDMRNKLGVEKTNALLKDAGIEAIEQKNDRKYIERAYLGGAPEILGMNLNPVGPAKDLLFSKEPSYTNADFAFAGSVTDKFVAKNRTIYDKVKATASGLVFETLYVDRFAGFERLSKIMESLVGTQMMYYLRMYDQRMNFVSQAVGNGALQIIEKTRADGRVERVIEAGGGASIANTVGILKQATPLVGNGEAVNRLFTMYMSAIRAEDKGFAALHFGEDLTPADLKAAKASIDKNPEVKKIFDAARAEYNAYNKDMMNFLAQTGAISKEVATELTKNNDYIPWYRARNGVAELVIGSEAPIKIGNIKEQPYLQELIGGDRPILDFMTSSVQNTNMLADMGLRNLSTKNAVIELANMGLAKIGKTKMAGPDIVRFKVDGEDRYAIINTDDAGVPADVLVKGMEGIPTQMPGMFRLLGMPATFLRKAVTASPLYAARQLFRDSLAAPILAGADFMPVIGAVRQIGKGSTKETLERRGITGGQIFTGSSEDISKILRDIANDSSGWVQAFGKLEAINMEADASTRRAQYNSYIKQGLSEMEATLMSLESMNFNKRGASPSVHWANSLIPFFNAQIQGLNVLYKAIGGKLPFNEKLKIQRKILLRGGFIAAGTLAYAYMMQDDEAYKNARPEEKYGNWFIRIPGVDEPVRLPIPFEIGYIFKALPEALYNSMVDDHGSEEAVKAFSSILKQTIPGGSSYGIPQALRPAIEAGLGRSFYTGRDILSASEKNLLPEYQFRDKTSEVAKTIGSVAGVSPIILDSLVQGYTGAMGLAFVQAVGVGLTKQEGPQTAVKRLSDLPVVGSAFQPNDAGAISNRVYERMNEFKKVKSSVDNLLNRGNKAEALELLNKRGTEYAMAEVANYYTSTMRELTQYEKAIKASSATPEEKRRQLEELRKLKTRFSATVEQATDKTIPQ
jgi:hypothetical protein